MRNILLFVVIISFCLITGCDNSVTSDNCGDGVVDIGEECDGQSLAGNYCQALGYYGGVISCNDDCTLNLLECKGNGFCGDNVIQADNESCDGANIEDSRCESIGYSSGTMTCSDSCRYDISQCEGADLCGNGSIESPEQCDGTELGTTTCSSINDFVGGVLKCGSDCRFDTSECYNEVICGDGVVQGDEECDGENMQEKTCESLGYTGGTIGCTDCKLDISECEGNVSCGDGIKNGLEECDGEDLGHLTCDSMGYYSGTILCSDACLVEASCEGQCGDGIINGSEVCDGTDLGTNSCNSEGFYSGTLGCSSDCQAIDTTNCSGFCGDGIINGNEVCDGTEISSDSCKAIGFFHGESLNCNISCFPSDEGCNNTIQWGTTYEDYGMRLIIDSEGSIYVLGNTAGQLGDGTFGLSDGFITKYDNMGYFQWSKQWGSDSIDNTIGGGVDSNNNIYITGFAMSSLDGNTSYGNRDIVLLKYTSDGTKLWTKQWGTSGWDAGSDLIIDDFNNVYITGYSSGALEGNSPTGGWDIFLMKCTSDGTLLWTKLWGTSDDEVGLSMKLNTNIIYISGFTKGSFSGFTGAGLRDIFLTKLTIDGTIIWNYQWGNSGDNVAYGLTGDSNGNIYVVGDTDGSIDGNINLGGRDFFLSKFTSDGSKLWTRQWGSNLDDFIRTASSDINGNIYIAGGTMGDLFGNGNIGDEDLILIKYSSDGMRQWVKQWGTTGLDAGYDVILDSLWNIFITGEVNGALNNNTYSGNKDTFLIKVFAQ